MLEISLSVIFIVLMLMNVRVFLFQRTVRKISFKTGIDQKHLNILYSNSYLKQYTISKFRWAIIIVLIFLNWIYALVLVAANFIIYIVVPEQDDIKNMKMMLCELEKYVDKNTNSLRGKIGNILKECGESQDYGYVGVHFDLHMTDNSVNEGVIININEYSKYNEKTSEKKYKVRFDNEVSINNRFPSRYYTLSSKDIDKILKGDLLGSYVCFHEKS